LETRARSIAKALSWRVGGLIITTGVAWALTRRVELAASIGLADTVLKLVAYYAHERAWLRIKFGRPEPPEYEI
jgi:adenylylsulfate kinase